MQEKQKVTLYLPPEMHRKMKIRGAVDGSAISAIAQRAIEFYLTHPDIVDGTEPAIGRTHQVYSCPECDTSVVLRDDVLVSLRQQPGVLLEEAESIEAQQDESLLLTC
ncbi:MAG: hypothetical protein HC824_20280 [Synechococcales cyanobacterium RM1_1_8]|nr:hypothetical protein [Synechococcales cyanobacterium RM1_1_8]